MTDEYVLALSDAKIAAIRLKKENLAHSYLYIILQWIVECEVTWIHNMVLWCSKQIGAAAYDYTGKKLSSSTCQIHHLILLFPKKCCWGERIFENKNYFNCVFLVKKISRIHFKIYMNVAFIVLSSRPLAEKLKNLILASLSLLLMN